MSEQAGLSPGEVAEIVRHAGDAVVVGAQALAIWGQVLGVPVPGEALTRDIDFLGDSVDAANLANRLGGVCRIPSLDDHTPNSALVTLRNFQGRTIQIDYLHDLAGLNAGTVRRRALEVGLPGTGIRCRVMHPYDCLESRVQNLALLPHKDTSAGVRQAAHATHVMAHYLARLLNSGERPAIREALNFTEKLADLACSEPGLRLWVRHGLDLLDAMPPLRTYPEMFRMKRYPQIQARIDKKRARFAAVRGLDRKDCGEPEAAP